MLSKNDIKNIKSLELKKFRDEKRLFVAEGHKLVGELLGVFKCVLLVATQEWLGSHSRIPADRIEAVTPDELKRVSLLRAPQNVLAVFCMPDERQTMKEAASKNLVLALDDVQDPGNLGTIFRTAEAAGVKGIILGEGCVDLYNPKVIRSTMGSVYRMPYIYVKNLTETMEQMRNAHVTLYAATLTAKSSACYDKDYRKACAFLIGNESKGLSEAAVEASDEQVYIPMEGQGESLNASVAAAVLMFEAARQRKFG